MDHPIVVPRHEHRTEPILFTLSESGEVVVLLEEGAHAMVICLCRGTKGMTIHQHANVAAGAHLHWINVTLGGGIEQSLVSTCTGEGAVSTIDWAFRASGEERQSLSAKNIFSAAHGGGEITMKGVAEGRAHAAASGMIGIGPKGTGTHTYLTQNVLMLDPTAKVDVIPGLEIKTNDVKASHSATVSRVTPEDLFYFGARGIAIEEARRMYIEGFFADLLAKVADPAIRAQAQGALMHH
ncbi:MAG: Fe-S cluster assembly protein SufD [Candidatus Peregrinibacteria bacterium Greene0416_62]|nr:MAG: Fe-S cluster assembly protein SufD [Candidatus Peregrinibacteria bacterium Greene0416_62]